MTFASPFPDRTARFGLPLLFPGQAQKEFFLNQALCLADFLHHAAVLGEADTPPAAPEDGEFWLIGENPSEDWFGRAGALAGWQAGAWHFIAPTPGMKLFDRSTSQFLLFRDGWRRAASPEQPSGGTVVDEELRAAFTALVEALEVSGILSVTE
ncbi:DUF2793 domain-containing protein [Erythrobacter sp. HKB08]|uniref:DUF2793 domain-containing protein n=1 Tax=Erythrobacter sp. HKB08 TaxID=2502843 RepID=UPI0010089171|nr:DUF2793 domain-containing protein [Erythrobacter sp. HKB08]